MQNKSHFGTFSIFLKVNQYWVGMQKKGTFFNLVTNANIFSFSPIWVESLMLLSVTSKSMDSTLQETWSI